MLRVGMRLEVQVCGQQVRFAYKYVRTYKDGCITLIFVITIAYLHNVLDDEWEERNWHVNASGEWNSHEEVVAIGAGSRYMRVVNVLNKRA